MSRKELQRSIDSAKRLAQLLLEDPHLTQKTRTVVDTVVRNLKWLQNDLHQNGPNENLKVIVAELTDTLDQLIPSEPPQLTNPFSGVQAVSWSAVAPSEPPQPPRPRRRQHDWRPDWFSVGERESAQIAVSSQPTDPEEEEEEEEEAHPSVGQHPDDVWMNREIAIQQRLAAGPRPGDPYDWRADWQIEEAERAAAAAAEEEEGVPVPEEDYH